MRAKANFTVFKRTLASGNTVYYYQCYDERGKRQAARSTGMTKKTEANAYCMALFRVGKLLVKPRVTTFAEYAAGWWDKKTCRYVQWRELHDPMSVATIDIYRSSLDKHLKEYFGKYRLNEISPEAIEEWFSVMVGKGLKPATVNKTYQTLRTMLGEAVNRKLIKENPTATVKELKEEEAPERVILTAEEAAKLFPADWQSVWDSLVVFRAHQLAARTGLRIGELRGLRGIDVFDDYIFIRGQYTYHGYSDKTKTKKNRNIPITAEIRRDLDELVSLNGDGYVFSEDGGATPVTANRLNKLFGKALERIKIDGAEKKRRNLSFHSWRHFFNTMLRMSDVADSKVQLVTGHLTLKMTDHYTHFDTRQFTEVRDVQTKLLTSSKDKKTKRKIHGRKRTARAGAERSRPGKTNRHRIGLKSGARPNI
jgi:integrase